MHSVHLSKLSTLRDPIVFNTVVQTGFSACGYRWPVAGLVLAAPPLIRKFFGLLVTCAILLL